MVIWKIIGGLQHEPSPPPASYAYAREKVYVFPRYGGGGGEGVGPICWEYLSQFVTTCPWLTLNL